MSKILLCSRGEGAGAWLKWEGRKEGQRNTLVSFHRVVPIFPANPLCLCHYLSKAVLHISSFECPSCSLPWEQALLEGTLADSSKVFALISFFLGATLTLSLSFRLSVNVTCLPPCCLPWALVAILTTCSGHYAFGPCMIGASHCTYSASTTSCPNFPGGTHCHGIFVTLTCPPALLDITGAREESSEVSIRDTYQKQQQQAGWLVTCLKCGKWPNKSKSKKEIKDFLGSKLEVINSIMACGRGKWCLNTIHSAEVNRVDCWCSPCCLLLPLCIQPRIPGPGTALATGPRLILSQNAVVTIPQVNLTKSLEIFLNPVKLGIKISQHDWWRASQPPTIN